MADVYRVDGLEVGVPRRLGPDDLLLAERQSGLLNGATAALAHLTQTGQADGELGVAMAGNESVEDRHVGGVY